MEKKHYDLCKVTTREAELVSKRIESLSVETRKQYSYTKKYEKLKNHIDLVEIQFLKERQHSEKLFKDSRESSIKLALEMVQMKTQLASKVGDKDIKELSHIVHTEYATNEIVKEAVASLERRFEKMLIDKTSRADLKRLR
jgi:hypothetical protein